MLLDYQNWFNLPLTCAKFSELTLEWSLRSKYFTYQITKIGLTCAKFS